MHKGEDWMIFDCVIACGDMETRCRFGRTILACGDMERATAVMVHLESVSVVRDVMVYFANQFD